MSRVIVVGSGIAGLSLALTATASGHQVTVVTKGELGQSNTRYAQGGVAVALFDEDSVESHISDTLAAGAGLCDPEAVRVLCAEGPDRIRELIALGVAFDEKDGELAHGLEAAHSFPRILHAGGDATGAVIEAALVARLRERQVVIHEHAFLLGLRTEAGPGTRVVGAEIELDGGARRVLDADAVVLATGGAGQLYPYTSNPVAATGDGVACAARIGARLADIELYQFHPTTLAVEGNFLVSEAVRGEGAVLRNAAGERFMADVESAELAPRDVVARAVHTEMARQGGVPVTLDATALGADFLPERFPSIDAAVRAAGLDWASEPIPITPAAHYWMGGIATDLWGRTNVPGLLAIGECARTGVHGANRLASNSLLEGAVFAHRAALALDDRAPSWDFNAVSAPVQMPEPASPMPAETALKSRGALQQLMWDAVGLVRDGETLARAIETLDAWAAAAPAPTDRASHEDANLLLLAQACARAALTRTSSVGAHFRSDDAATEADASLTLLSV
ncbi:L-aspartate oxidase [Pseudactinotalea sp.]|uniref:L-aspartate oxidase n=1 Tax=Pseudactinotalea sp. TaxID=1926260 RepID=UPI003B3B82D6